MSLRPLPSPETSKALTFRLLLLLVLLLAVGVPGGYFAVSYIFLSSTVPEILERDALALSRHIYANPELWQFRQQSLAPLIELEEHFGPASARLLTLEDVVVVAKGETPPWPRLTFTIPVMEGGRTVARLEMTLGLRNILEVAGLLALLGAGLAAGVLRLGIGALRRADRSDKALAEATAQLQQAQKMEAVGQLTGGVAHDFNNLLMAIVGNLDILEGRLAAQPDNAAYATRALEAAEKGATLIGRLLAFSRKQSLMASEIDLNQLVRGVDELLRRSIGQHIELSTTCAELAGRCFADTAQLEAAILNLVLNARDAIASGGKVTLATHAGDAEHAVLSVSDNGIGMTPEVQAQVFEPFFTTKEVGKGSGLGLSMVHGFVEQSGGRVELRSAPGAGTTVRLYLPRRPVTEAGMANRPVPPPQPFLAAAAGG